MKSNRQNSKFVISAATPAAFINDGKPQIVLSGRSNVGKSSLINSVLSNGKLARTSSAPGKTVMVNFYSVDNKFYFVDLPGYGYAKRSGDQKKQFGSLTDSYLNKYGSPSFVLQLIDLKVGPTGDDCMMLDWLSASGIPYAVVATKADKLNKTEREKNLKALETHPLLCNEKGENTVKVIPFSALKGEGKEEVFSLVISHISENKNAG